MTIGSFLSQLRSGPLIGASILAADFSRLGRECRAALDAGADFLHLDIMDGHFVPNLTMGPDICRALRRQFPDVCLDAHLMVSHPESFVKSFADAGASHLTVHVEAALNPTDMAGAIHQEGMTAGLAINPLTNLASILPHVAQYDVIVVMCVNPGFAGQSFIPEVLNKAKEIRAMLRPDQRLEIDGGVNAENAGRCVEAGGDVLVAASAIFGQDDYARAVSALRIAARSGANGTGNASRGASLAGSIRS